MRLLTAFLVWLFAASNAFATTSLPVDTGRVEASLLSSHYTVAPGQTFQIALKTTLDDEWHTYWRNPGDSGEPVQISWVLPDSLSAGEIVWPLPYPIPTGPIINYGFEGAPLFPVDFTVAADAAIGSVLEIQADVYYLVCKDICIPEEGVLRLILQVTETAELNDGNAAAIAEAINLAPQPLDVTAAMQADGERLSIQFADLPEGDFSDAYFFPYDNRLLVHSDPQVVSVGPDGISIETTASFGWQAGFDAPQMGVLAFKQNDQSTGHIVTVQVASALAVGASLSGGDGVTGGLEITLLGAIVGAFLGGLILNLMPCVFPVISLKALSLAKSAHAERKVAQREAWAYTAGVMATFLLLVLILLAVKAGGAALGWGFQLQNPIFIGLVALLLFAIGLNLIGVYEIPGGSYQNLGSEASMKTGWTGSFFTGGLAVLVATPCTAPFMAGAIGYALTQPTITTVTVFAALAVGFALPFLFLAYAPGLLSRFPRPGPWMVTFRQFLAFPMFGAAIFFLPTSDSAAETVLWAALVLAFGLWLLRFGLVWKVVGAMAIIFAIATPATPYLLPEQNLALETDAWSPERVAELRAEGRAVFVDFTADWCVTCKVNERLVLKTDSVQQAFADTNTAFLIADWTNKNDEIARELESYGRAGVPLYLYFPPGDNSVRGEVLPQVLTTDLIVSTLKGS